MAFDSGEVALHAKIVVRMKGQRVETTVGRVILSEITPKEIPFSAINQIIDKTVVKKLISLAYRKAGIKKTVIFADRLKDVGYRFATSSGLSICITDMEIPQEKQTILDRAMAEVKEVEQQYREGLSPAARSTTRSSTSGPGPPTRSRAR
jgi:DNA-directed RNA polymerase subunit beta'